MSRTSGGGDGGNNRMPLTWLSTDKKREDVFYIGI